MKIRYFFNALALITLAGCAGSYNSPEVLPPPGTGGNLIDAASLNELMLTVSDPEDAVTYFSRALTEEPGRADFRRGQALALARARRHAEAADAFAALERDGIADDETRIEQANSLARLERRDEAQQVMARVSGRADSARRYLIDAMLADEQGDWAAADRAYDQAKERAVNPSSVLNNHGVSMMSRGNNEAAEKLFTDALAYDPNLFNAKNNLAVSRALQGEYRLPMVAMSGEERAVLLHNIGVIALRRGDRGQAKGLFAMAVEANPKYYPEAAEKLAALGGTS